MLTEIQLHFRFDLRNFQLLFLLFTFFRRRRFVALDWVNRHLLLRVSLQGHGPLGALVFPLHFQNISHPCGHLLLDQTIRLFHAPYFLTLSLTYSSLTFNLISLRLEIRLNVIDPTVGVGGGRAGEGFLPCSAVLPPAPPSSSSSSSSLWWLSSLTLWYQTLTSLLSLLNLPDFLPSLCFFGSTRRCTSGGNTNAAECSNYLYDLLLRERNFSVWFLARELNCKWASLQLMLCFYVTSQVCCLHTRYCLALFDISWFLSNSYFNIPTMLLICWWQHLVYFS